MGRDDATGPPEAVGHSGSGERAPRVLLACEWFVKYTAGLARGLADIGCDVVLLTRDHDLEFGGEPGAMRAFVRDTLDGRARHLELGGRVRDLSHARDVFRLRRECREWRPDVVHVQDSLANDMRLAVAVGMPRRYALTAHDPAPHPGDAPPSRRVRATRRFLRRRATVVFVHSRVLVDELRDADGGAAPIEVVPHGFGAPVVGGLPDQPRLLFFGRISYYKGLDTLLDAMPLVWERRPDVNLTIAGEGDLPPHSSVADARVTLRNEHVPEAAVSELFTGATCVVLPYRQASQSGVGSEAKRHGRAIVSTSVGGLPELVGGCGRLVPPEDPGALAQNILEVIETPGLAAAMGARAAASVEDAGWRTVAERTLGVYRQYLL